MVQLPQNVLNSIKIYTIYIRYKNYILSLDRDKLPCGGISCLRGVGFWSQEFGFVANLLLLVLQTFNLYVYNHYEQAVKSGV